MPRGYKDKPTEPRAPVPPVEIKPTAVFSGEALRNALGLRSSTLRREIREGRLRVSKRAGRHFFIGAWILEWLKGGEVARGSDRD